MQFSGDETVLCATRILERWEIPSDRPWTLRPVSPLEEEREEVFESVLQAMATAEHDSDLAAACRYLLRHLALGPRRDPLAGLTGRTGRPLAARGAACERKPHSCLQRPDSSGRLDAFLAPETFPQGTAPRS